MSFIGNKLLAAASGRGDGPLSVEDVFSTFLYIGNSDTTPNTTVQTITTGIDIHGEGGLLWVKSRDSSQDHYLTSPELFFESIPQYGDLNSNSTADVSYSKSTFGDSAWSDDGFNVGDTLSVPGERYVSWSFRKAPKFLDVVAYTGDGTSGREIPHDLGSVPGVVIIKRYNNTGGWSVHHRSIGFGASDGLRLEQTTGTGTYVNPVTNTTSSTFTPDDGAANASGSEYIAYLFAHNDGDGEFGPNGDQDIIKCGSYTGTGSAGNEISLGFEPQYLLIKNADSSTNWYVYDILRGLNHSDTNVALFPDSSSGEATSNQVSPTPTGFVTTSGGNAINGSGQTYVYIAIRRGPMRPPEDGSQVFSQFMVPSVDSGNKKNTGFVVDTSLQRILLTGTGYSVTYDRLRGSNQLKTNTTDAESGASFEWDYNDGYVQNFSNSDGVSWNFGRAPGFFDTVAYTGHQYKRPSENYSDVPHNLGVVPEMIWIKSRDWSSTSAHWVIYHKALGNSDFGLLDENSLTSTNYFGNVDPTDSVFTLFAGGLTAVDFPPYNYIAYLFASLDGISRVGNYTGNGSSQTIDCGFSSGARFVLVKRTDATGDWYVWDTERGIVSGTESYIELNTTDAEDTTTDSIDPDATGFIVNQNATTDINASGGEYIFYAIA